MSDYLERAEKVAAVAAQEAKAVDGEGKFPEAAISALRKAGLLGLVSAKEIGGLGQGPRAAARVVERIARECPSTAMVTTMHYCGAAVIEKYGSESVRREITAGKHHSTLSFSEAGSGSHFWVPVGRATLDGDQVVLNALKTLTTAGTRATAYVWSSKPTAAEGLSTLWLVPRNTPGISISERFNGLGLRGNDSTPIVAKDARIPVTNRLGEDGGGFAAMMEICVPYFIVQVAAGSIGIMEAVTQRTASHAAKKYEHSGQALADLPTIRSYIARMRIRTDMSRTLWLDTLDAVEQGREDAILRLLETKAATGEAALEVTDTAMRVCGGSAFRRDVGVERYFRDSRASSVMAPTTDQVYDLIGKAVCGLPLF